MDETPFYKRPWSYIIGWLIFLLIVYGWQIYRIGGFQASLVDIIIDLVIVFPIFLVWMAFFAQFVLPVRTFEERQKIFDRLITHLFGGHGPAMFIRNGEIIKREGEEKTKGPGVVWLDSASAAVTRTAVKIKQTMGPGVHFLDRGEFIAGTIDLHIQSHSLGPKENDKPFEPKSDEQSEEEYKQIQDRCKQVTALTRDGIEIVPTISVTFRVNTGFPKEGQPGSRFGYRTGNTKKDKANEEKDKEAIRNAILGESIKYTISSDSPRHRVAWNQLPTLLAVDVWREYVGKFTLDELFRPDQVVPASPPQAPQPTEEEVDPLSQPLYVGPHRETMQSFLTGMLRQINLMISKLLKLIEGKKETKPTPPAPSAPATSPATPASPQMKTALQVINDMVKARLTKAEVDILDDNGRRGQGTVYSPEYELLTNRGLIVQSVSIGNLRMHPKIEAELINHWESTWLKNAKTEREQIERRRNILQTAGEEKAARGYATALARGLMKEKPVDLPGTLKSLLMRSRLNIIKNEQLRRLMSTERQEIEEILQWMESDE
jgi:hypothetical protein